MAPVYLFIREVDQNNILVGNVFEKIRAIGTELAKCSSNDSVEITRLCEERLQGTTRKVGFHSPIHSAAMLLNPRNWEVDMLEKYGDEVYGSIRGDFLDILGRICAV